MSDDIEEAEYEDDVTAFTQYIPACPNEYRRMWCLSFAHSVCPDATKLKDFAKWCERYLSSGAGGPTKIE